MIHENLNRLCPRANHLVRSSKPPSASAWHGMKCGKPQCACHRDPARRHGPYFEWSYKVAGKTVSVKLSPQAAPLYQAATRQHSKLKTVLARLERLSRTAVAQLAKQAEKTG